MIEPYVMIRLLTSSFPIQARVLYYMLLAASEDEEIQKQGMVGIVIMIGNKHPFHLEGSKSMAAAADALPIRWPMVHFW